MSIVYLKGKNMQKSKNTARVLLLILVAILSCTLGSIVFVALWPFLDIVGKMLVGLAAVMIGCAVVLAIAWTHHKLALMALARDNYLLSSGEVVAVVRNGQLTHLSAVYEEAKRPLLLPSPVQVTEEPEEDEEIQRAKVLLLREKTAMSLAEIADHVGVKPWKVQKWTSEVGAKKGPK
jgi:hypothetical protein